ncbi:uncharacterized protein NPIL_563731 [Nephila pilipes]|uniref:Uncharacterized protein n=1 Tax=Nephila pilipes TaxID=299642 RepID=A0A8X6U3J0_NEPPI|nr:uncharacterized protein NPIL_563731 [Nephila pilipes]
MELSLAISYICIILKSLILVQKDVRVLGEEKLENIPDVVVFSEKAKSEEAERLKYSSNSAYWNPITLPTDQEVSPQAKLKGVECTPPWSTADWVIPPQPVEMVTLQFHRPPPSTDDSRKSLGKQPLAIQSLSTIPEGATTVATSSSSFAPQQSVTCAKQTDV